MDDASIKLKYESYDRNVEADTMHEAIGGKSKVEIDGDIMELPKSYNLMFKVEVDNHPARVREEEYTSSVSIGANSMQENITQTDSIKKKTLYMGWSKSKQQKKKQREQSFELNTFNRFEVFKNDTECETIEDIQEERKIFKALSAKKSSKVNVRKRIKSTPCVIQSPEVKVKKINRSLIHLEHKNRFDVLEDNPEEDVQRILKRRHLISVSRHSLKKCNKCCFKKRNCLVDPSTCKALQSCCFTCGKKGHYPQSLFCKARK